MPSLLPLIEAARRYLGRRTDTEREPAMTAAANTDDQEPTTAAPAVQPSPPLAVDALQLERLDAERVKVSAWGRPVVTTEARILREWLADQFPDACPPSTR
jgi:hypothetical protein